MKFKLNINTAKIFNSRVINHWNNLPQDVISALVASTCSGTALAACLYYTD